MNAKSIRRAISSGLAFALILAAPGIEPYRLLASVTGRVPVQIATPGLGSMAAGGAVGVNAVEATVKIGDQLDLGLNTALPTVGVTRPGMPPVASEAAVIPSVKIEAAGAPAAGTPGVHVEGSVSPIQSRAPPIAEQQKAVANPSVRMALKNGVRSIKEAASPSARFGALKSIFSGGRKDSSETPVPGEAQPTLTELETAAAAQYDEIAATGRFSDAEAVGRLRKAVATIERNGGTKAVEALRRIESKVSRSPAAAGIRDGIRRSITDAEETAAKQADSGDAPDTPSAPGGKFWTKAVIAFIGGLGLAQIAQEFFGQSMPQLIKQTYGDFSVYASVMFFSLGGRILGNAVGGVLPDRFGLKKTFLGAEIGRAVSIGVLVGMLLTGSMSIPLYFGISAVNGFFTGITLTSEHSIPRVMFGKNQALLEKFWGYYQFILEFAGIGAPIVAGYIISTTGTFAFTLGAYPVILIAAIAFFAVFLKVPDTRKTAAAEAADRAKTRAAPAAKTEKKNIFKQIWHILRDEVWKKSYEGAKVTLTRPALRTAAMADAGFLMINVFLYAIIAPAFGLFVAGSATAAAPIQAWTVGIYSFGSMLGSLLMLRANKKLEKKKDAWEMSDDDLQKKMEQSALRWMLWGALSLVFFLPMITGLALPSYIGVFLFGIASVVPMLKLKSLAGRLTPEKDVTKVMGFIQMATSVISVAAVYGLSNVFDIFVDASDIPTAAAFIVLNVALGAMAAALVGMRWYLKRNLDKPLRRTYKSDRKRTKKDWAKLSANLKRLGIDSYKTIKVKEEADHDRPTVAILAPPSAHKLPILQEGGRQSPGDVHLVFDASWLIQEELPGGKTRIFLKKGLYFDADGQAVVAEYKYPKQVRYFANFFTAGANERTDGNVFEKNLDVPQSSSLQLERTTNDKLLTRIWMAAKGVAVPATLALLMAAHPLNGEAAARASAKNGVTVAQLPAAGSAGRREDIRGRVEAFLKDNAGRLGGEVVVKPSGPQWHSSKGVAFFKTAEIDAIVEHILALEKDGEMTEDGSILIDQRLTPPALHYRSTLLADDSAKSAHDSWGIRIDGAVGMDFLTRAEIESGKETTAKKDFNLGVYAMRAPWGRAKAADVMVRAGAWGKPTVSEPGGPNGDWKENIDGAATIIKYEDVIAMLREQHGLLATAAEAEAFTLKLKAAAEKALEAVWENEEKPERKDGEPYQAKTDFVRLDIMPHYQNGELVPMVIEVNDHDSGGQIQIDEFYPDRPGTHTREWIATMLDRARDDALKGKTIVVVGAGYEGKRFVFEKARKLGVKVVLVDRPGSWAAGLVDEHIEVDTLNLGSDEAADRAMEALEKRGLSRDIDGITSFWEDDIPTTAKLAEKLELPYFSYRSAVTARNKSATRGRMQEAGLPTPRFAYVNNKHELEKAIENVGFPAVLKPASGAEAKMVFEVRSAAEARTAYAKVVAQLPDLAAGDGAFNAKLGLLLEQYLEGDEVDVDLVMRGGVTAFDSITDNWPTRRPYFLATGSNLPSTLPADGQKALKKLAVETAKALGLNNGVLHIEAKLTPEGPRLIEANARMGGTYVHDWVEGVWGVDLVKESFMAAAGVPGPIFKSPAPLRHLSGEFLIPERSGLLRAFEADGSIGEKDSGLYRLQRFKKPGQNVEVPPDGNDRVGMLTAQGRDAAEAAANLKSLRAKVKVDIKTGSADSFLTEKISESPRGMKFAKFQKGEYKPEYEARLREMGVDVINIRNPSRAELEAYRDEDGYYVQPRWVRWVRPALKLEDFLASLPSKKRGKFKKSLGKSEGVPYEVKKLTVDDFEQWHPIYMDEVVGKPGGRMHLDPQWARRQQEAGKLDDWYGVFFRDPETHEMISGMLFIGLPERGYVSMGYAAHRPVAKTMDLSKREVVIAMEKAVELGYSVLSAGADTNFYGYDYDLGLLGWKAAISMIPYPEEPLGLTKVLDPKKFAEVENSQGERPGYFFFSLKREGKFWERYLESADGEPKKALELLGAPFMSAAAPSPGSMMVGNHFYFDDVSIQSPGEVETLRRPIEAPAGDAGS